MAQQAGHQPDASSSDPLAGIITQVSPTGHQPGRAPARPTKPRTQSKPKQKASKTANVNKPEPSVPQQQQQQQQEPADQAVSGPQPADQQPSRVYDQQQQQRNNTVQGASQNSSVEDSSRQSHGQDASSTLVEAPVDAQEGQAAAARTQAPASRPHTSDSAATKEHAENRSKEQRPDTPQSKSGKKKGKGKKSSPSPWTAFLMALGCVSKDAYDDNDDDDDAQHGAGKPLKRRKSAEKQSQPPAPNHHATPSVPMTEITRPSNDSQQPYQGPSTTTQEQQQREMAPLGVAPAEPAAMSSAPPSTGIPLPPEETGNVMSGAVVPPGADGHHSHTPKKRRSRGSTRTTDSQLQLSSTADESGVTTSQPGAGDIAAEVPSESSDLAVDSEEEEEEEEEESMLNEDEEEERIIQAGGMGIPVDEDGNPNPLLAPLIELDHGRKCLVLDLDETLVHSSFKQIQAADYIVPVEIENQVHNVFVIKRPGVDEFLRRMGEIYEVVVFTASLSKYADPVLDQLDIHQVVRHRLFRESCYNHKGNYVKDLSQLGRPINDCIIIDNSPASYIFHPKNAVPVSSWFNDPHDTELVDMIGVLADLAHVDDVRSVLDGFLDIQ